MEHAILPHTEYINYHFLSFINHNLRFVVGRSLACYCKNCVNIKPVESCSLGVTSLRRPFKAAFTVHCSTNPTFFTETILRILKLFLSRISIVVCTQLARLCYSKHDPTPPLQAVATADSGSGSQIHTPHTTVHNPAADIFRRTVSHADTHINTVWWEGRKSKMDGSIKTKRMCPRPKNIFFTSFHTIVCISR